MEPGRSKPNLLVNGMDPAAAYSSQAEVVLAQCSAAMENSQNFAVNNSTSTDFDDMACGGQLIRKRKSSGSGAGSVFHKPLSRTNCADSLKRKKHPAPVIIVQGSSGVFCPRKSVPKKAPPTSYPFLSSGGVPAELLMDVTAIEKTGKKLEAEMKRRNIPVVDRASAGNKNPNESGPGEMPEAPGDNGKEKTPDDEDDDEITIVYSSVKTPVSDTDGASPSGETTLFSSSDKSDMSSASSKKARPASGATLDFNGRISGCSVTREPSATSGLFKPYVSEKLPPKTLQLFRDALTECEQISQNGRLSFNPDPIARYQRSKDDRPMPFLSSCLNSRIDSLDGCSRLTRVNESFRREWSSCRSSPSTSSSDADFVEAMQDFEFEYEWACIKRNMNLDFPIFDRHKKILKRSVIPKDILMKMSLSCVRQYYVQQLQALEALYGFFEPELLASIQEKSFGKKPIIETVDESASSEPIANEILQQRLSKNDEALNSDIFPYGLRDRECDESQEKDDEDMTQQKNMENELWLIGSKLLTRGFAAMQEWTEETSNSDKALEADDKGERQFSSNSVDARDPGVEGSREVVTGMEIAGSSSADNILTSKAPPSSLDVWAEKRKFIRDVERIVLVCNDLSSLMDKIRHEEAEVFRTVKRKEAYKRRITKNTGWRQVDL